MHRWARDRALPPAGTPRRFDRRIPRHRHRRARPAARHRPRPRRDDRAREPGRAARSRRRRLPHRHEVDDRPLPAGVAPLRGLQRGRGRAGNVQGPRPAARQPVPGHRRTAHRRVRGRRREVFIALKASFERGARARDARGHRDAGRGHLPATASRRRRRSRGVPVRRGEGAARGDRGQRAAAPRGCRRTCTACSRPHRSWGWSSVGTADGGRPRRRRLEPDPRQQRRDARQRPARPRPRRRLVPSWARRAVAGHRRVHGRRRRRARRRRRGRARHHRCARSSTPSAADRDPAARSRRCSPA